MYSPCALLTDLYAPVADRIKKKQRKNVFQHELCRVFVAAFFDLDLTANLKQFPRQISVK